ncbi:MAG: PqiC family protein [Betaproteobacteria bacterium]|nr:PqiC family protein [Betaproteobacteria bacterium]
MLGACVSPPRPLAALAVYDLGLPAAPNPTPTAVPLRRVEVFAAPWLNGLDMQYRYTDAGPNERRSFAENRWAATPAQLIEPVLARDLAVGAMSNCKLSVRLEEFTQLFDAQGASSVLISGSISLRGERLDQIYLHDSFDVRRPAESADPAAGVKALREATDALSEQIRAWLTHALPEVCGTA